MHFRGVAKLGRIEARESHPKNREGINKKWSSASWSRYGFEISPNSVSHDSFLSKVLRRHCFRINEMEKDDSRRQSGGKNQQTKRMIRDDDAICPPASTYDEHIKFYHGLSCRSDWPISSVTPESKHASNGCCLNSHPNSFKNRWNLFSVVPRRWCYRTSGIHSL